MRALEAAARLLWPIGDRGLAKRLHRITAPTLLLWGSEDRIVPASYAKRFAAGIAGRTRDPLDPERRPPRRPRRARALAEAVLDFMK